MDHLKRRVIESDTSSTHPEFTEGDPPDPGEAGPDLTEPANSDRTQPPVEADETSQQMEDTEDSEPAPVRAGSAPPDPTVSSAPPRGSQTRQYPSRQHRAPPDYYRPGT